MRIRHIFEISICSIISASIMVSGCSGWKWQKRETGALIGAATGAVIGTAGAKRHTRGALIGAAAGAIAGGLAGWQLDRQEAELSRITGLTVQKVENASNKIENSKDQKPSTYLLVTAPGSLLFDSNSTTLKPGAQKNLQELASILQKYPSTSIEIAGHTDSNGSEEYNQRLSERRAEAVKNFMVAEGVDPQRIKARGYGETMPVSNNDSPEGRQMNRRVDRLLRNERRYLKNNNNII